MFYDFCLWDPWAKFAKLLISSVVRKIPIHFNLWNWQSFKDYSEHNNGRNGWVLVKSVLDYAFALSLSYADFITSHLSEVLKVQQYILTISRLDAYFYLNNLLICTLTCIKSFTVPNVHFARTKKCFSSNEWTIDSKREKTPFEVSK